MMVWMMGGSDPGLRFFMLCKACVRLDFFDRTRSSTSMLRIRFWA